MALFYISSNGKYIILSNVQTKGQIVIQSHDMFPIHLLV